MGKGGKLLTAGTLFATLLVGLTACTFLTHDAVGPVTGPESVGFTFSERQAGYLAIAWRQAFEAAMNLQPSVVRLGAYWDSIELKPGVYDFTSLDWMLDNVPSGSSVMLTVGMKAPRWPEYFLPGWLESQLPEGSDATKNPIVREAARRYITQVILHERNRKDIRYWQVENEPLDASGPNQWRIDPSFLSEEVALVRSLDPTRPVVVNMFVDTSPVGGLPPWHDRAIDRARTILNVADILGLDVYPVKPVTFGGLDLSLNWPAWEWESRVVELQHLAQQAGRRVWISEAQAEPWLPASLVYTASAPYEYTRPGLTTSVVDRLQADGFNTILLWGVEYWYMRVQRYKDGDWWSHMQPFFRQPRSQNASLGLAA